MRRTLTAAALLAALVLAACGRPDPPEPEHRPEPQAAGDSP
ncbi:LPS translocon maturation chaperone LptM [Novilysobacter defluvii]|nr:hypothetical protein [Lysobacter defluvii]